MHKTSYLKVSFFSKTYVEPYLREHGSARLLDVGSKTYKGHPSYRDIFEGLSVEYVGLDLEPGHNVHVVPGNPFLWSEIEDESFDFCISGQAFEHNPFFWITFAEMARVLKQDGMLQIVAPGRGKVHRYPVDCWRFYPDSWQALCNYCGLDLVEADFEDFDFRRVQRGSQWCDSCLIARKPRLSDHARSSEFYARLQQIVSTLPEDFNQSLSHPADRTGPCLDAYNRASRGSVIRALLRRLRPSHVVKSVFRHL